MVVGVVGSVKVVMEFVNFMFIKLGWIMRVKYYDFNENKLMGMMWKVIEDFECGFYE